MFIGFLLGALTIWSISTTAAVVTYNKEIKELKKKLIELQKLKGDSNDWN